jgi:hypothetical protein
MRGCGVKRSIHRTAANTIATGTSAAVNATSAVPTPSGRMVKK